MHKIDLLKGQGLPVKTTIGSVFFAALIFVVPLLIAAAMVGFYLTNKTEIGITTSQIERLDKIIADSEPNASKTEKMRKELNYYATRLNEVAKCVKTYVQWTPVLIDIVKDKPEQMVMKRLEVVNDDKSSVKKNNDPNKPLVLKIPQRKMTLEINGDGMGDYNLTVQEYQNKLRMESSLQPDILRDLKYLRKPRTNDSNEDTYTMNFVFQRQQN